MANHNSPLQTVISGTEPALAEALARLTVAGLPSKRIPVACAFHSPVVAKAAETFKVALSGVEIHPPAFPVWSNTTAAPHGPGLRDALARHLARPVRFVDEIEAMYETGARVFVEAGPGGVLTKLVGAILGDRPHTAVACDLPGDHGLRRLLLALAELAVAGVPIDVEPLLAGRARVVNVADVPSRPGWLVDGHLVRRSDGQPLVGGLQPATRLALPATTSAPTSERDATVLQFLQSTRDLVAAQRDVMLAYLGSTAPPIVVAATATAPPAVAAATAPEPAAIVVAPTDLTGIVLDIVSARTGYPRDMLDPDLDLEADLSIGSIKRTEMIGELADRIGLGGIGAILDESVIEDLARIKTIAGIVAWLEDHIRQVAAPLAGPPTEPVTPLVAPATESVTSSPDPQLEPVTLSAGMRRSPSPVAGGGGGDSEPVTLSAGMRHSPSPVPSGGGGGGRMGRYVVEVTEIEHPPTAPLSFAGRRFVVVDDGRGIGLELADLLEQRGASVLSTDDGDELDTDHEVVHLAALRPGPLPVLPSAFAGIRRALLAGSPTLLLATGSAGTFGHGWAGEEATDPTPGAGLRGLARTIAREYPDVLVRAVDIDTKEAPQKVARHLLDELATRQAPTVVGYTNGTRTTLTVVEAPAPPSTGALDLGPDAVVLLTGGARGITARAAIAIAAATGCHVELVGRTPPPAGEESAATAPADDEIGLRHAVIETGVRRPVEVEATVRRILAEREVRATLEALAGCAASVRYHVADVRDPDAVRRVVDDIHARHGRLDGVVHGAGVCEDGLLAAKSPESFARVFETKVAGATHLFGALADALAPVDLRFLALFGSVSGVYGNRGQSDYAAANDALDTLARVWRHRLGHTRVVSVDWGPWSAAGGGMVSASLEDEYARRGLTTIDPDEGVAALLAELAAGPDGPDAGHVHDRPRTRRRERMIDVAIVGMGAVFPGAGDVPTFWRNICEGVDSITDVPASRWDPDVYFDPTAVNGHSASDRFYCRRGGFVDGLADFDPAAFGIMPNAVAGTEPDQLLALRTAAEAIADAGGDDRLPDRNRIGVIIGRGGYITPASARMDQRVRTSHQVLSLLRELVPGITSSQLDAVRAAFDDQLGPAGGESAIGLVPNFAASRVANRFDFRGPAYTVDAACASSLVAVDHAVRELASGRCDAVLAGAVHHCHVATLWSVFTQLKALSPSQAIRPFDRRADGTLMSEGTGIVLLKRLADAERAGDRVYAVIRGTGVASDGRASSLMSPLSAGQLLAVEQAWTDAGLDPTAADAIGLLEAHGTATPTGDQVELETVARAFGGRSRGADLVPLGTVKSNIGHAMPAAGIAGLIKAALAVHHGVRPPTLHVEEPHPALAPTRFRPVTELEPWDRAGAMSPRRAGVNAFGFGGINAHVVLEEAPGWRIGPRRAAPPIVPAEVGERVLLLAASTTDDLARQLAASDDELLAAASASPTAPGGGPVRLSIVEPSIRTLALARKVVARGTPWPGRSDLWFTADPLLAHPLSVNQTTKIAFLFPGFEPEFEPRVDDVADHLRMARPNLSGGDELVERSLDIIAVGRLLADALGRIGVRPDVMAGHSLGEWTAMIASGLYERASIDEFVATLQPGVVDVPDLVYAALGCGADRAATAIAGLPDIAVSHDNCPHQSVICGSRRSVDIAVERLRADQVMAQPMPFKSGFHSPMLAPYLGPVRDSFDRLPIHRPSVPVWSATTVGPFPDDPAAVRDLVIRHLLEPVRFGPLTRRLHADGVRAFVQVGPGSLPGFVDDTLAGRRYLAVTANVANRSGMAQLRRVAAALWTEGRDIRWDRLSASTVAGGPNATPSRTTVRLDLGTPLVRLNGSAPQITGAQITAAQITGSDGPTVEAKLIESGGNPVLAELGVALQEATDSARRIVAAWQSAAPLTAPAPAPTTPPPAPRRSSVERTFSLDTLPYVRDHCLLLQPEGWADDSDRFPVVPLTTLLELMADVARDLMPGGTVVGFDQIRALRWLVVAPATTTTVSAVEDGPGRVKVTIEGYSNGTVLLADNYPVPPVTTDLPLTGERTPPVSAAQLYDDRWMFHGPRFAGVDEVTAIADDGIRGVLRSLPTPGALLDSAGQLIGHWMQVGVESDRTVFPVSVDAIRLYGPQPPEHKAVACTARLTGLTDTEMRADAILRTPDGGTWCRIDGWTTRRFATDDVIWKLKFNPEVAGVGESQLGGWCLVGERWPGTASRELMMRRYLNAAERTDYEGLSARRQRQWLLGRIAAKDAVRQWLWDQGHGPVFPCEISVTNDPTGQPRVAGPFAGDLHVSIAHSGELGVAMVSPNGPVGIDVEAVDDRALDTERIGFTAAEHRLLDAEADAPPARTATATTRRPRPHHSPGPLLGGQGGSGQGPGHRVPGQSPQLRSHRQDRRRARHPHRRRPLPDHHPTHRRSVRHLCRGLDHPSPPGGSRMIQTTEDTILDEVVAILVEVIGEDFLLDTEVTSETSFNDDLAVESIEFVALAERLRERYGDRVDFVAFVGRMELEEIVT